MTWLVFLSTFHTLLGAGLFFGCFAYSVAIWRRVRSSWVTGVILFGGMCFCLGLARSIRLIVEDNLITAHWQFQVALILMDTAGILGFFAFRQTARIAAKANDATLQKVVGDAIKNLRGRRS